MVDSFSLFKIQGMHIQLYLLGEPEVLISSPHGDMDRHSSRVIGSDLQSE